MSRKLFRKGNPGGPGRPKGPIVPRFLLAEILDEEFDWRTHLGQAFRRSDLKTLAIYEKFAPYLFVQLRAKELDIKVEMPLGQSNDAGVLNRTMKELLAAEQYGINQRQGSVKQSQNMEATDGRY